MARIWRCNLTTSIVLGNDEANGNEKDLDAKCVPKSCNEDAEVNYIIYCCDVAAECCELGTYA
eukprot:scaffold20690_cov155-Skeletonema_dohrnii-CCMP3373.AAC.5